MKTLMIEDPHFHYFSTIVGHEFNIAFLRRLWRDGRLPPALLFAGPGGVGKKSTAFAFAKFVLSGGDALSPEASSPAARKVEKGLHPDFHELAPRGGLGIVPVDDVRELQDRLSLAPLESAVRVVLLPRAEGLHPASANALLKSLEEPPPHALFILVCENPDELLPTILSRCMKTPFFPLSEEAIAAWLKERGGVDAAAAGLTARLSQGRPGEALSLLAGRTAELREAVRRAFDLHLKHGENAAFLAAYELDRTKAPLTTLIALLIGWVRDLLMLKSLEEETERRETSGDRAPSQVLMNADQREILETHAQQFSRDQLLRLLDLLLEIQGDLHRILYKTLVFEHIFLSLSRFASEDESPLVV
ncbi:MAG: DNA polymerase III subunit delta' [Candidatus Sumerlaeia bacterium]